MPKISLETLDIIDPGLYVQRGYPHEEWSLLRSQAPVFYYQRPNVRPFWAVTTHADIVSVSRQPDLFRSGQYLFVTIDEDQVFRTLSEARCEAPETLGICL